MNRSFVDSIKTVIAELSTKEREVLKALQEAPNQSATASDVCSLLGLAHVVQINHMMGQIGKKLYARWGAHPDGLAPGEFQWWHMVATGEAINDRGFVWRLRAEIVTGLIECVDSRQNGAAMGNDMIKTVPQFWTVHWQNSLWQPKANIEGYPIKAAGSHVFQARGVKPGDVLYVISLSKGHLLLGGRMVVSRLVSRNEASQMLETDNLFKADQWAINTEGGSLLNLHRRLAPNLTKELLYIRANGVRSLKFVDEARLDNQATRGLSQLTEESARLLDLIIEFTDSMPHTTDMLTVNRDLMAAQFEPVTKPSPLLDLEPWTSTPTLFEGMVNAKNLTIRERNQKARDLCIEKHGWNCAICDVNFELIYGSIGKEFIHVHHLEPLANATEVRKVDPTLDLIPVCPNCHAMVHRRDPPFSIAELSVLMQSSI